MGWSVHVAGDETHGAVWVHDSLRCAVTRITRGCGWTPVTINQCPIHGYHLHPEVLPGVTGTPYLRPHATIVEAMRDAECFMLAERAGLLAEWKRGLGL